MPLREPLRIAGPAGDLEALLEAPSQSAQAGIAVVCHPHPLYQGTMRNKVVHTLCRALHDLDLATLRFNFRGVGGSEGAWAGGFGETEDVLAACTLMRGRYPDRPLWLAGFSFGAAMAIRAAARTAPAGLVTVAPPPRWLGPEHLPEPPGCTWLLIQGEADEVVPAEEVQTWADGLPVQPELIMLPGVGHFFHGQLDQLRMVVGARLSR